MVNNSKYFYLSGLLSLSLFALFLVLFISIVLQQDKLKQFALKKDNYISVSINMEALNKKQYKKEKKKEIQKKPQPKKEIKQEKPKEKPKPMTRPTETPKVQPKQVVPKVSDLFSAIQTEKIVPKKEIKPEIDKKLLSKLSKQTQKKEITEENAATSMMKKIEITSESASTSPDVNEYLAKIQAIIYEQFYPPINSAGESAIISIRLDRFGKLISYRVLTYSRSDLFNSEVDRLESRLKRLTFVKHPEGKTEDIKIILTSQE